jgi:hypothetical protein
MAAIRTAIVVGLLVSMAAMAGHRQTGKRPVSSVEPYFDVIPYSPHLPVFLISIQTRSGLDSVPDEMYRVVDFWVSDTAFGPPSSTPFIVYGGVDPAIDVMDDFGQVIREIEPGIHYQLMTNDRGLLKIEALQLAQNAFFVLADRGRVYCTPEVNLPE